MLDQSPSRTQERREQRAEKCPLEHSTQFYWIAQGLEYRCRHCKQVQLVPWEQILRHYHELVGITT